MVYKNDKGNLLEVLCLKGLHGAPRARTCKKKIGNVRPGLYERERERERESTQLFGTTK